MHAEDIKLVGRLMSRDQVAFQEFFDDYFPRLFRFTVRRVGDDPEAARDIVQAALTRGVRRLETYRGEASLFTWLCQITRRELSDHLVRLKREQTYVHRLVELEDDPNNRAILESIPADAGCEPEAVVQREDLAARVHAALDYLPSRYAKVLELKYLEELSVEAIAARLGVSVISVQSLLARARQAFREVGSTLLPSPGGAK
ncbi:MAG: RNA polymerase sigma factor [Steroidobacteraceae bacterium]